ncbi:Transposase (plasmid) [Mycetohabitans rhizoxinica HKI 454]|uniref:Transposase n=1 Tax=Mycetohabitans rhizoxinica (strain DSM 19002 / CIP 109453 / HKI 454) TaxID=882378 RepID=E5ATT4_MYCRK|nr:Transposase [Mycetohabitans rhizoxinica HKI 454]
MRHKRPRRNKAARLRQPKQLVTSINEIGSMDFLWSTRKPQAQTGGG